ncbi:MAG: LamG domain-containing protein [Candidatus Poribacteria bacterium]|nr:LamG domain-containing protein [Candidatus Poribacteria bacterium]
MRKRLSFTSLIVALAGLFLYCQFAANADLVGQWLFDDGDGDIATDTSGNGNDGQVNNAKWVAGKFGKALEFSGAASNVEIKWAPELSVEEFTLMAWVNVPNLTGDWQTIVTQNTAGPVRNYGIFINNNGGVIHYSFTSGNAWQSFDAKTGVANGAWHNICATYDRKDFKLYIDAKLDAQTGTVLEPDTGETLITIGSWIGGGFIRGAIDEVALFNHALDEDEVQLFVSGGLGAKAVDPTGKAASTWATLKQR